ncbi:transposase family protein [Actinophytocola sp.]|uniref:transposase family protein n=1 Tax=Actinophytocola sp. TaxID=1872138 RepID=UPI002D7FA6DD|nr:transposase family protein [Actinophytocola sp.]HET9141530.1 transposase family protein [Actinophytocola sp.]
MTGLSSDQVAELVSEVFVLLGGAWQPVQGRRRVLGLYRAVVLALYLMRRNESQAVAGELFGCSQSSVSRVARRLRPLLRQATAQLAGQVRVQAKRSTTSTVLIDGFLAPTGERAGVPGMYSGKRHDSGFNVQAVSDLAGRLVDTGLPCPGGRHDSKALAESGVADRWASHLQPDGPGMLGDLGYLGTPAITGTRKPPKGELTDVQRACNTSINSLRAAVERAIAHLTNWKILDTGWRGRLTEFPEVLRTVTGLEIYRVWS